MKFIKIIAIFLIAMIALSAVSIFDFSGSNNNDGGTEVNPPSKEESDVIYTQELTDVYPVLQGGDVAGLATIELETVSVEDYSYLVVAFSCKPRVEDGSANYRYGINSSASEMYHDYNGEETYKELVYIFDGTLCYLYVDGLADDSDAIQASTLENVYVIDESGPASVNVHFEYVKVEGYSPDCDLTLEDIKAIYGVE